MIQLVASKRGIAALPYWAVLPYLEKGYVVARKITEKVYIVIYMRQFEWKIETLLILMIFMKQ